MKDTSPLETLEQIMSRWWILAALLITGGLIGWLISMSKPPLYEARATMIFVVEYEKYDRITFSETDQVPAEISAKISERAIGSELIQEYGTECKNITIADMRIERRESFWTLVVRCSDLQAATNLANAWADKAYSVVDEAYLHSLKMQSLLDTVNLISSCNSDQPPEVCAGISDLDSLEQRIESLWTEIGNERQASQGIIPDLIYGIESYASIPTKPAMFAPGNLIAAGAIIGLLIGFIVLSVAPKIPKRRA